MLIKTGATDVISLFKLFNSCSNINRSEFLQTTNKPYELLDNKKSIANNYPSFDLPSKSKSTV